MVHRPRAGLLGSALCCVCLALTLGCQEISPEVRQLLTDGAQSYEKGDYNTATTRLTQFVSKAQDSPEVAEALYVRGLCQLKLNRRSDARADFQQAIQKALRKDLSARAQASLAVMAFDEGNWAQAAALYSEALPWIDEIAGYDEHMLRHGTSLQRLGQWEPSRQVFAQLIQKYPNGAAARGARDMLAWNHPYFTVQCHVLTKPDAAAREVTRLRKLGLEATQLMDSRGGQPRYLVQVGQYKTYDEAAHALERVKPQVPQARVMP